MTYDAIKDMKTVGILRKDKEKGVMEIGVPMGIVAALIPSTNPTSTVTPMALLVPDISTSSNMLLTLFGISELYGLTVDEIDGEVCMRIKEDDKHFAGVHSLLSQWLEKERAYQSGEISKGAYDAWKYQSLHFPMPPVTEE